jgi:predicted transcriptional regulator
MQLLHAHPWRSASEIAEALGYRLETVHTTLTRLKRKGAICSERRGRFVYNRVTSGCVRTLPCYAIAPVELVGALESNLSLTSIPERIVQIMKEKGGWWSVSELIDEMPGTATNSMNNALATLIRRGHVQKDREWRWVRIRYSSGHEEMRHVELNIFSLKEGK